MLSALPPLPMLPFWPRPKAALEGAVLLLKLVLVLVLVLLLHASRSGAYKLSGRRCTTGEELLLSAASIELRPRPDTSGGVGGVMLVLTGASRLLQGSPSAAHEKTSATREAGRKWIHRL
jgi:hypothetical protein